MSETVQCARVGSEIKPLMNFAKSSDSYIPGVLQEIRSSNFLHISDTRNNSSFVRASRTANVSFPIRPPDHSVSGYATAHLTSLTASNKRNFAHLSVVLRFLVAIEEDLAFLPPGVNISLRLSTKCFGRSLFSTVRRTRASPADSRVSGFLRSWCFIFNRAVHG